MSAIVFTDSETLGLDLVRHPIWELAAIRREEDGVETTHQWFIEHDRSAADELPEPFRSDYITRYDPERALPGKRVIEEFQHVVRGRAHIVGAVPNFDTERISHLRRVLDFAGLDPWHHHLIDVEALALGYLRGRLAHGPRMGMMSEMNLAAVVHTLPWDSDALSEAMGVQPGEFARHTAMGDVLWAKALYDAVMGS